MRLPKFKYVEPKTLREAVRALASNPRSVLLAGGTDLLVNMKHRVIQPEEVVDLKPISKLAYLSEGKEGLKMGALTSLHGLASSSVTGEKYPALVIAAKQVAAYTHQVMGTLGGNLCQGNRCRYYNQSTFWRSVRPPCYKVGGRVCHVVPGRGAGYKVQCHSAYCGDLAPVLIALDSQARVTGPDGERALPLKKLYTQNGKKPLSLKRGEILREILVPPPSGKCLYLKWRLRDSLEFPIISLATHLDKDRDGKITKAKIIFSSVGPGPVEAVETEKLLKGSSLDERTIERAATGVSKEISPMRTSTASPAYKRKMAGILLKQALEEMKE
jgi:4-hydroxybenzoyl-CoA reductase subunit beta